MIPHGYGLAGSKYYDLTELQYQVVSGGEREAVEGAVAALLQQGWTLVGGLQVSSHPGYRPAWVYHQALQWTPERLRIPRELP